MEPQTRCCLPIEHEVRHDGGYSCENHEAADIHMPTASLVKLICFLHSHVVTNMKKQSINLLTGAKLRITFEISKFFWELCAILKIFLIPDYRLRYFRSKKLKEIFGYLLTYSYLCSPISETYRFLVIHRLLYTLAVRENSEGFQILLSLYACG